MADITRQNYPKDINMDLAGRFTLKLLKGNDTGRTDLTISKIYDMKFTDLLQHQYEVSDYAYNYFPNSPRPNPINLPATKLAIDRLKDAINTNVSLRDLMSKPRTKWDEACGQASGGTVIYDLSRALSMQYVIAIHAWPPDSEASLRRGHFPEFIANFGWLTMEDLYVSPYPSDAGLRSTLQLASKLGILRCHPSLVWTPAHWPRPDGASGNKKCCQTGTCTEANALDTDYCDQVSPGVCSAASDPCGG